MSIEERVIALYQNSQSRRAIAEALGIGEGKVRSILSQAGLAVGSKSGWDYQKEREAVSDEPKAEVTVPTQRSASEPDKSSLELTGDAGWLTTGTLHEPVKNWDTLLLLWNLDPGEFEVVEPVTMKAWDGFVKETSQVRDEQTGELKEFGEFVSKRLYSYKARIQRKSAGRIAFEENFDFDGWSKRLHRRAGIGQGLASDTATYVILVADPQLGKPGTEETLNNWYRGVEGHTARIKKLQLMGQQIERVVIAFMGDEHEGVCNNYVNQPYEVELSLSAQLELDLDMRLWTIARVGDLNIPMTIVSVVSNHGEFTRNGSHLPVTDKYDNSSTMVARFAKKVVEQIPGHETTEWLIAENTQDILTTLSGVKVSFSHGHIAKGRGNGSERKTISAIEKQILGRTEELGDVQIYFTAHYHHAYYIEDRGRTFFGCPALEAEKSSQYFYDQYGVWSKPGMAGLLVGTSTDGRCWSEHQVC